MERNRELIRWNRRFSHVRRFKRVFQIRISLIIIIIWLISRKKECVQYTWYYNRNSKLYIIYNNNINMIHKRIKIWSHGAAITVNGIDFIKIIIILYDIRSSFLPYETIRFARVIKPALMKYSYWSPSAEIQLISTLKNVRAGAFLL